MNTKSFRVGLAEVEKEYRVLSFGRLLKSHRLGEELTQVEMAKRLKLSKQGLNDLESGRKIPSIRRAVTIARRIHIMDELAVQLVLQDRVRQEKLNFKVIVTKTSKAS